MFGIGFFELVVLGLVSLVVLGPERLPGAIRTLSLWIGRLRRNFNSIKADIEKEIGADEIRRQLRNEEIMEKFRNTQSKVQNSIQSIKKDADTFRKNVELEADAAAGKIAGQDETNVESETASPATPAPALENPVPPGESPKPAATPEPVSESPSPAPESTEPKSGS